MTRRMTKHRWSLSTSSIVFSFLIVTPSTVEIKYFCILPKVGGRVMKSERPKSDMRRISIGRSARSNTIPFVARNNNI
ncbi:hypothetical protein F5X98DRAFT_335779 [Xylaria grammica]|nr:hypothetical protein F5X98DRAFT_335779 [Xylaria grammica]